MLKDLFAHCSQLVSWFNYVISIITEVTQCALEIDCKDLITAYNPPFSDVGGTPTTPTLNQQPPYFPASPTSSVNAPPPQAVRPMMSIPGDGLPATLEFREDGEDKLLSVSNVLAVFY